MKQYYAYQKNSAIYFNYKIAQMPNRDGLQ